MLHLAIVLQNIKKYVSLAQGAFETKYKTNCYCQLKRCDHNHIDKEKGGRVVVIMIALNPNQIWSQAFESVLCIMTTASLGK